MTGPARFRTIALLVISKLVRTFAWYGHPRAMKDRAWGIATLLRWGSALFAPLTGSRRTDAAPKGGGQSLNLKISKKSSRFEFLCLF